MVFLRDEARLRRLHKVNQQPHSAGQCCPRHPAVVDEEHDALLILPHHGVERGVVSRLHPTVEALGALRAVGRAHDHGAEGGAEREGVDARDADGRGHRYAELGVEDARRAAHECHGDEHGHEDDGTRDDGHRHVAHRILRGLVWRLVADVELRLHGLDDDDRVVHHRTDGQHEGEQRQDVDTEAEHRQAGEGADQRHHDRDRGDDGALEVLQEEVNHQDDEQNGDDERLHHVIDRGVEEVV